MDDYNGTGGAFETFPSSMELCTIQSNSTDIDPEFEEKKKVVEWIAYRIIGPAVVGIGLLGNVLNLIVLTRPSLKGVTYSYLIGLAFSDIGVLICSVTMMMRQTNVHPDSWLMAFFFGHLEYPLANTCMASSIFIVVCLTVDRFASVCMPTKFKTVHTESNARMAMTVCYVVAFVVSVPLSLLKKLCSKREYSDNSSMLPTLSYDAIENDNVTSTNVWKVYIILEEIIVRFGPAFILAVLNALIICRFRQITQKRQEIFSGTSEKLLLRGEKISKRIYKEEKRLVILLTAIVLLFFVTTTPVAFLAIFYTDKLRNNLYFQIFRAMANDLELCNFALNFYIYFLCSKEFRKKFLSFFTVLLPQKAKANFQSITLPEISNNKIQSRNAATPNNV